MKNNRNKKIPCRVVTVSMPEDWAELFKKEALRNNLTLSKWLARECVQGFSDEIKNNLSQHVNPGGFQRSGELPSGARIFYLELE